MMPSGRKNQLQGRKNRKVNSLQKKKHVLFLTLQHFATQGLRCFAAEDTSKHQGSRLLPVHTGVGLLAQEVDLGRCEGLKT